MVNVFLYYFNAFVNFYFYTSPKFSFGFIVRYDINARSQNDNFLSYAWSTKILMRSLSIILSYERIKLTFGFSGTSLLIYLTKSLIDYSQCYFLR